MSEIDMYNNPEHGNQVVTMLWDYLYQNYGCKDSASRFCYVLLVFSSNKDQIQLGRSFAITDPDVLVAINEWDIYTMSKGNTDGDFCICGHPMASSLSFRNRSTQNILRIGSSCIEKFGFDTELQIVDDVKLAKKFYQKTSTKMRQCQACGNYRIGIKKPKFITRCKTCYNDGVSINPLLAKLHKDGDTEQPEGTVRKDCLMCGTVIYTKPSEVWKDKCLDCFKTGSKSRQATCRICDKLFYVSEPDKEWKKLCKTCYDSGGTEMPWVPTM